jgi:hypothetical protein
MTLLTVISQGMSILKIYQSLSCQNHYIHIVDREMNV